MDGRTVESNQEECSGVCLLDMAQLWNHEHTETVTACIGRRRKGRTQGRRETYWKEEVNRSRGGMRESSGGECNTSMIIFFKLIKFLKSPLSLSKKLLVQKIRQMIPLTIIPKLHIT